MPAKKGSLNIPNHKKSSSKDFHNRLDTKLLTFAINATNKAVVITDSDGNIEWVNNSFSEITQYKLEEIKGQNPRILKSGIQDNKFYKNMWDTIKSGNIWDGRLFNRRKDGSIYLDEQTIYPFNSNKSEITHFVCIKSDISNQAYTNEKILAQDHLLHILPDAVITTDEKLNITGTNNSAEIIFGIPKSDLLGKSFMDFIANRYHKNKKNKNIKTLIEKGNDRFDILINANSSSKELIEARASILKNNSGYTTGYVFLIKGIKQQYEYISKDLANNINYFNSVYDSISQPILIFDKKYKIVASNKLFLDRLKLQPTQVYQKKINEISDMPDKYIKIAEDRMLDIFQNKKFRRYVDKYDHSSKHKTIEAIFFPIGSEIGQVDFVGLLYKDISEEKSVEKENIESEKLEDIGKMTTYILHQIKTPLNAIKMNIDMMSMIGNKELTREKSYQLIQKEVNRLSRMIKEVMQYSRISETKPTKVSIYRIVNDIRYIMLPLLKKKSISLINIMENREIIIDNDSIITVFYHLIENSIEAINCNGQIVLSSKSDENEKSYRVFIEDSGCGISKADKIFEPFYTTKKDGTGLGLAIIKNILGKNNSEIKLISSKPGKTIFELKFPVNN